MLAAIGEAISGAMRADAITLISRPLRPHGGHLTCWRGGSTPARISRSCCMMSRREWALDLSAQDDLAESGLFQMLAEEPRLDEAQGALSAF